MNSAQRVVRNKRMAEARSSGMTIKAIAAQEHVSTRTVREAIRAHTAAAIDASEMTGAEITLEVVAAHIEALRNLRGDHKGAHEAAHLGRAVAAVGSSLVSVLDRCGRLPGVEVWRDGEIIRALVEECASVMIDHRIPAQAAQEAMSQVGERWGALGLRSKRFAEDRPSWISSSERARQNASTKALLVRLQGGQITIEEALAEIAEFEQEVPS